MKRFIITVKDNRCDSGMNTRAINTDDFAKARKFAKKHQNKAVTNSIIVCYGNTVQRFNLDNFLTYKTSLEL